MTCVLIRERRETGNTGTHGGDRVRTAGEPSHPEDCWKRLGAGRGARNRPSIDVTRGATLEQPWCQTPGLPECESKSLLC